MSHHPADDPLAYYLRPLWRVSGHLRSWFLRTPLRAFFVMVVVLGFVNFLLTEYVVSRERLIEIIDNAFVAIVAAACLGALKRFYSKERRSFPLRQWLGFDKNERTTVAVARFTSVTSEAEAPCFDAQAAGLLSDVLRGGGFRHPMRQTLGAHRIDRNLLAGNVVTVSMPTRNDFTRVYLGLFHDIYVRRQMPNVDRWKEYVGDLDCAHSYLGLHKRISADGRPVWGLIDLGDDGPNNWKTSSIHRHGPEHAARSGHVHYDYGMIVKGPNPFDNRCGALVVCGIHGMGTLGAALYLHKYQNEIFVPSRRRAQHHLIQVAYSIPEQGSLADAQITRVTLERSLDLDQSLRGRHKLRELCSATEAYATNREDGPDLELTE